MTQDKIDMSLDDLISANKKGKGGGRGGGGGRRGGREGGGRGGGGRRGPFRSRSRSAGLSSFFSYAHHITMFAKKECKLTFVAGESSNTTYLTLS